MCFVLLLFSDIYIYLIGSLGEEPADLNKSIHLGELVLLLLQCYVLQCNGLFWCRWVYNRAKNNEYFVILIKDVQNDELVLTSNQMNSYKFTYLLSLEWFL